MVNLSVMNERYLDAASAAAAAASAVLKMIVCLSCCAIGGVASLNPGRSNTPAPRTCARFQTGYEFTSQRVAAASLLCGGYLYDQTLIILRFDGR